MIHFDNRAGSKNFPSIYPINTLHNVHLTDFESLSLPGDVYFLGNFQPLPNIDSRDTPDEQIEIGIEIKRLDDYLSSLDSGRGSRLTGAGGQVDRMVERYDVVYLIIYGSYYAHDGRPGSPSAPVVKWQYKDGTKYRVLTAGVRPAYWTGIMSSLAEIGLYRCITLQCSNKYEVALLVTTLYQFWQKPWKAHKLMGRFSGLGELKHGRIKGYSEGVERRAKVLTSLCRGINFSRGVKIAEKYRSVSEMIRRISTNPEELEEVEGIGKVLSGKIWRAVVGKDEECKGRAKGRLRGNIQERIRV